MAKRTRSVKRGKALGAVRSAKAGSPPVATASSKQVQRRKKSARAAVSKGTIVFETDRGPRAAWPASTKMRKKS